MNSFLTNIIKERLSNTRCLLWISKFVFFEVQACLYSLEKKVPLIAFGEGRCLTLFDHPLTDALHTIYHEPKVLEHIFVVVLSLLCSKCNICTCKGEFT